MNKRGANGKLKTIEVTNDDGMTEEVEVWNSHVTAKLIWRVADKNVRNRKSGDIDFKKVATSTDAAQAMLEDLGIS